MTHREPDPGRPGLAALGGWSGGAAWGLVEVFQLQVGGRLDLGPMNLALVAVVGIVITGLPGGAMATLASLSPVFRRGGFPTAFAVGLATLAGLAGGLAWFTDPPPFQEPLPLQGNPFVFVVLVGLAVAALVGVAVTLGRLPALGWGLAGAVGVVGLAAVAVAWSPGPQGGAPAPNLLMITLDTTRADQFGPDGIRTPTHDRLAREGSTFDLAFSQIPATGPSHATLLSGRAPWENGMLLNGDPVPADAPWLAEQLAARGYACGAYVSGYVLDGGLGFSRGFHVYDDDFWWLKGMSHTLVGRLFEAVQRRADPAQVVERRAAFTIADAADWVARQDRPWFLWVHLFDPHAPYEPPPPFDQRYYRGGDPRGPGHDSMPDESEIPAYVRASVRGITDRRYVEAQYAGEIAYADESALRLLNWLDDSGQADDTLVVYAADHGEGLGEHGQWFEHGGALDDAALHVPLVVRFPGRVPVGHRVRDPVELTDVAPTVLDLLSLDADPRHTGISLRPVLSGGTPPRVLARSIALDQDANRRQREVDPGFPPTYRMASVRGVQDRYVVREADGFADERYRVEDGREVEVVGGTPTDPFTSLLLGAAADVLRHAPGERASLSASDRAALEALGYTEGDR